MGSKLFINATQIEILEDVDGDASYLVGSK